MNKQIQELVIRAGLNIEEKKHGYLEKFVESHMHECYCTMEDADMFYGA